MSKKSILMRVDLDFKKMIDDIKVQRIKNGLEKKTIPDREATRMILNTNSKPNLFEELTKKPRRNT